MSDIQNNKRIVIEHLNSQYYFLTKEGAPRAFVTKDGSDFKIGAAEVYPGNTQISFKKYFSTECMEAPGSAATQLVQWLRKAEVINELEYVYCGEYYKYFQFDTEGKVIDLVQPSIMCSYVGITCDNFWSNLFE